MKKFLSVLTSAVLTTACAFSLAACGGQGDKGDKQHAHDYATQWTTDATHHWHECKNDGCDQKEKDKAAHADSNNDGKCDVCEYVMRAPYIKMDQFMSANKTMAEMFVDDYIRSQAILAADEDVKSETCTLIASASKEELHAVKFAYTTKLDDTRRAVKIATATLKEDLLLNDIVEHYSSKAKLENGALAADADVTTETIFEFDAKQNYEKQNIAEAVYNAYDTTSEVKLYNQTESPTRKNFSVMTYLQQDGNTYKVHSFEVSNNNDEAKFISNIGSNTFRRDKKVVSTHTLDGEMLYNNGYTLEEFKEIDPPGPVYEDKVVKAEEITAALDANYKEAAVKSCFPSAFKYDEANLSNVKWNVTPNDKNQIVSANFSFNTVDENGSGYYALTEVNFESPVDIAELTKGNLPNATYNRLYRTSYDANIQDTRKELTNAICEKVFTRPEGAVVQNRYIIDSGSSAADTQLTGIVRVFQVIEVTDKGVQSVAVRIKESESDAEYINKLESEENYRAYDKVSKEITGEAVKDVTIKVEKEQTTKTSNPAKATSARYVVTFGDSDEIMYI